MIETRDLTKKYGNLFAVESLDLKLEPGDVFGFIGPNGSGKTTTMRMLATLLNPTWGEAYVGGYSIYTKPKEIRRLVGYMPDFFGVYDDMKVIEYLEFFAAAYRIKGAKRRKVCNEVLDLVGLDYKRDALATSLSRGMTQRLGLARVLLHDPQVLLLDEPASGLDPRVRIEIRRVIRHLGESGKTVMVSSHILPELADMCNKIGIIEKGKLEVSTSVADVMLLVRHQVVLRIRVGGPAESAAKLLEQHSGVEKVEIADGGLTVTLREGVKDYSDFAGLLTAAGQKLTLLKEDEMNLETAFMALTKGLTAQLAMRQDRFAGILSRALCNTLQQGKMPVGEISMIQTVEAIVDENGQVRLLGAIHVSGACRALVTVLEEPAILPGETALLSEAVLAVDWSRPEEDAAWAHLQPEK